MHWGMSLDQARELAAAEKRPILIDFTGVNCANCRLMERRRFAAPRGRLAAQEVRHRPALYRFRPDRLDHPRSAGRAGRSATRSDIIKLAREATNPFYVVLSPKGEVLGRMGGYNDPPVFVDFLNKALEKLPDVKVTSRASRPRWPQTRPIGRANQRPAATGLSHHRS